MRVVAAAIFAAFSVVAGAACAVPASASDVPSVEQAQARLAASRARLNALYDRAAATGLQYNGAAAELAKADRALAREQRAARRSRAALADQSAAVAALTVQQLQTRTGTAPVLSMLARSDPRDILARASAYDSAAEAMTARMDELAARKTVHRVTQRRLQDVRDEQQRAVTAAAEARTVVNASLAESKRATLAAQVEQTRLMQQVAAARQAPAAPSPGAGSRSAPSPPTAPTQPAAPSAPAPVAPTPSTPPPAPPPPATPTGDVDPNDDAVWDRIAKCESGGNWHINTGNGYYGGLQFSAKTWHGIGGPGLPHEHPREVQISFAKKLQAKYGWGQWECAWARFP